MAKKFTVIAARNNLGFFTNFFHTLQHLEDAEQKRRIPIVFWANGIYRSKGEKYNGIKTKNIWEYYFEPVSSYSVDDLWPNIEIGRWGGPRIKDSNVDVVCKFRNSSVSGEPEGCWNTKIYPPNNCLNSPDYESRCYINNLIKKHVTIKKIVTDKADKFFNEHMSGHHVLGVHMRACNDHQPAQGHKPFQRYLKKINEYIDEHNDCIIFLATDYMKHFNKMKSEFGDRLVGRDTVRSKNRYPVQYACKDKRKHRSGGAKVGEEVLIDAMLLSRCNFLIRGFSNVASCASFMNPDMPLCYVCKYNTKLKKYLEIPL